MKQTVYLLVFALIACSFVGAAADPSNFEMSITPAQTALGGQAGSTVSQDITFNVALVSTIDAVTGWSFGVMVDPASELDLTITDVTLTDDLNTVNSGGAPGFLSSSAFSAADLTTPLQSCAAGCSAIDAAAVTQGVIVDMMMGDALDAAETAGGFKMVSITVHVEGTVGNVGDPDKTGGLIFTDNVGDPPTETLVVNAGNSIKPGVQDGATITLHAIECIAPAQFTIAVEDAVAEPDSDVSMNVILNFDADPDNPNTGAVQGWSYGLCVDTAKLTPVDFVTGGDTITCNGGNPPGFDNIKIFENGITHGVVVDMMAANSVVPQNGWIDGQVTVTSLMTDETDSSYITPCNEALNDPATPNVMVVAGDSIQASTFEGTEEDLATANLCNPDVYNDPGKVTVYVPPPYPTFAAGDTNNDGGMNLADGIFILNALFRNGPPLPCQAAADFNGDDVVDVADAVALIYWRLQPNLDDMPEGGYPGPAFGEGCSMHETTLPCDVQCDQ